MCLDTITHKSSKPKAVLFDSYGRGINANTHILPYKNFVKKLKKISLDLEVECNQNIYQIGANNFCCGHLCTYFLLLRARGYTLKDISNGMFGSKKCWKSIEFMIENLISG